MPGFELIGKEEQEAVNQIFEEGGILFAHGFDSLRKKFHVREFEKACEHYFKSNYCMAVSSGTAGIKCALKAIGIKPGDEVITQSFNFIATVEAIVDIGAIPIICCVDETLNMDIKDLRKKITKKTKAIIPVHFAGSSCEMNKIIRIAKKHKLKIIEDCAPSTWN